MGDAPFEIKGEILKFLPLFQKTTLKEEQQDNSMGSVHYDVSHY